MNFWDEPIPVLTLQEVITYLACCWYSSSKSTPASMVRTLRERGKKTTKPVSRILFPLPGGYHLSGMLLAQHLKLPTHGLHRAMSNVRLFGISARKVYPCALLPMHTVVSYTTFSPLPCFWRGGNFLWHCLFPFYRDLPVR